MPRGPAITIRQTLADAGGFESLRTALPGGPGVLVFRAVDGAVVTLIATADLRRAADTRLGPDDAEHARRGRTDLRSIVACVEAVTTGSAFETDWAYLHLARELLPESYRAAVDRWQPWFVEIDPTATFPQWAKTTQPTAGRCGHVVSCGPLPDKHAAGRYLDLLTDIFDLCRYHHILVQAPRGSACAYKEMGRCAAPCDGTISMDEYGRTIAESIRFASGNRAAWKIEQESQMREAAGAQDFECAGRIKARLDRANAALVPSLSHVRRLQDFAYVVVARSEHARHARLFTVRGGCIAPFADVRSDAKAAELGPVAESLQERLCDPQASADVSTMENIGLVCAHLFRPAGRSIPAMFIAAGHDATLTAPALANAIRTVAKRAARADASPDAEPHDQELSGERSLA